MESAKIRLKIGDHEFEAEGPSEIIQAQFEAFRELISRQPEKKQDRQVFTEPEVKQNEQPGGGPTHIPLERILRSTGRIVSLTALPPSTEDAALLIMLGNKDLRNNENVTGQEIGDGLAQSGRPVARTDRVMEKPIASAYVLKSGLKRATRYRLTNVGHQKALTLARELISSLP